MITRSGKPSATFARLWLALTATAVSTGLCGCVAVGYSSTGGWFIWPGGLGLLLLIAVVVMLLRRR